ncbi:MAG: formylglycine-generating enzyme family protein [Synechocystis sp.]
MFDFSRRLLIALMVMITLISAAPAGAFAEQTVTNPCPDGMAWIHGGTFRMGSDDFFPEEKIVEDVTVDGFCLEQTEVTNAQFAAFVQATGYVTVAERPLSPKQFPDLADDQRSPGSLVFAMPGPEVTDVPLLSWWHWVPGANWRHPDGPDSNIQGKDNYPVVQVSYEDAQAYATWAGKQLPTEAEWEFAGRGGLTDQIFGWGNTYSPQKANTWQGRFPFNNQAQDGYEGTAPVASFPPNAFGLYDMTGNVWEWTADWYSGDRQGMAHQYNPQGPAESESFDPREPDGPKHVIKGGSYLCAKNYCSRYRPAARESQSPDTGTTHIGFRLASHPV